MFMDEFCLQPILVGCDHYKDMETNLWYMDRNLLISLETKDNIVLVQRTNTYNITKQKDIHMEEILKTRKILYGR